jgi:antitoxin MazE
MKLKVVDIGEEQGIILPSGLIKGLKLSNESTIEIEVNDGKVILKPELRKGWAEAAKRMNEAGDDKLL